MDYCRIFVDGLVASGRVFPPCGGYLLVVRRPESPQLDWELVLRTQEAVQIEPSPYDLVITGPDDEVSGSAILVRSDGRTHVFRGAGEPTGVDTSAWDENPA